jgi:hypothetical protein
MDVTLRIPRMREANNNIYKLMCEEQHMHNERDWNIKHGLVHYSFAVGPAAR